MAEKGPLSWVSRRNFLRTIGVGATSTGVATATATTPALPKPDPEDYSEILSEMDGDGSEERPYLVTDVVELQAMNGARGSVFHLDDDIDASETANWTSNFTPIGDKSDDAFVGTFDGQGYEISDLTVSIPLKNNDKSSRHCGLFGNLGGIHDGSWGGGLVRDVTLRSVDISGEHAGGIAGLNWAPDKSEITGVTVSGSVHGFSEVGGIVGSNVGTLSNATSNAEISGSTADGVLPGIAIGGIAGASNGSISNVDSHGTVEGQESVGGIVGENYGRVTDSHSTATVSGDTSVGGAIGENAGETDSSKGTIKRVSATGDVEGIRAVGGLIGENRDGRIRQTYATGEVRSTKHNTGGLVGANEGESTIARAASYGGVKGGSFVGGLCGSNSGVIQECVVDGNISATDGYAGGAVGSLTGLIKDVLVEGSVVNESSPRESDVGGLVGSSTDPQIQDAIVAAEVVNRGGGAGALVGSIRSETNETGVHLKNCYWDSRKVERLDAVGETSVTSPGIKVNIDAVSGLTTEEMQGTAAKSNLTHLDFENTWSVATAPADYPDLQSLVVDIYTITDVHLSEEELTAGDPLNVTVSVRNTGIVNVTKQVELRLSEESRISKNVTLGPGANTTLLFQDPNTGQIPSGNRTYAVWSEDDEVTGSFRIMELQTATSTPESTPTETATQTRTETEQSSPTGGAPTQTETLTDPPAATAENGAGMGVLGSIVGLCSGAFVMAQRFSETKNDQS